MISATDRLGEVVGERLVNTFYSAENGELCGEVGPYNL